MPFDPCISLIHTPPAGRDLYAAAVPSAAQRSEAPPTPVIQYAGMIGGQFEIGTIFSSRAAMQTMFLSYTLPEGQREMIEQNKPTDLSREELEMEHIFIEERVAAQPYGLHPAGTIAGFASGEVRPSPEDYWALYDEEDWFERPIEGRIAHIAYLEAGAIRLVEFWENREVGSAWHHENVVPKFNARVPDGITPDRMMGGWIELDYFMVGAPEGDRVRNFVRRTPGERPG